MKRYGYKFERGGGGWGIGILGFGILLGMATKNEAIFFSGFLLGILILVFEFLVEHANDGVSISEKRFRTHVRDAENFCERGEFEKAIDSLRKAEIYGKLSAQHEEMRDLSSQKLLRDNTV